MPKPNVFLLYPGDRAMRDRCDPAESRFAALFAQLAHAGVEAMPAVYHDDFADEVEDQLRAAAVVLVWCNPIEGGRRRDRLDAMLRRVANSGTLVSAHPDVILKLGTKDVLLATRDLPFGSDVQRIDSLRQLGAELPGRLRRGARVLKQHRGHSGIGVWRVEYVDPEAPDSPLRVLHAQRGSEETAMDIRSLKELLAPYFEPAQGGHMIDQAWQPGISNGTVRAYLVGDRVAGFGLQAVNALSPDSEGRAVAQPGPRLYHDSDLPEFQGLKRLLETQWIDQLMAHVGIAPTELPLIWDCDFIRERPSGGEAEKFVLCEINVSSVSPFPPGAVEPLASAVRQRLKMRR